MSAKTLEFVDTNVLVYAYDTSAGSKRTRASDLLARLWSNRSGSLSIQVLQEFYVAVTRKIPRPLAHPDARSVIEQLAHWRVHAPGSMDVLRAIDLQTLHRLSFWDAMILQSAASLECARLWSEDMSHGQSYCGVSVENPFL